MILEIDGRLEIGRKFFSSLGSRLGVLRRGNMTALLKAWGNNPKLRDEFISAVSEGRIQSSISSRSQTKGNHRGHSFGHSTLSGRGAIVIQFIGV